MLIAIRRALREAALSEGSDAGAPADAGSQGQPAPKASVHERLKAHLFGGGQQQTNSQGDGEGQPDGELQAQTAKASQPPAPQAKPAKQENPSAETDAESETDEFTSLNELAERTGLSLDRILDLAHPIKAGDKESRASIREMLRSYQTSELLNSKLATHASEVAAWKSSQQQEQQKFQQNLQRLDVGLQMAQRMLQGEFSQIDWNQLQQADPASYAQTLLGFQQRQAQLDQVAQQLGKERQTQQQQQAEQHNAWISEQKQLLEAKLPEWSDDKTRKAAIQEIADVVGKVYGFDADHIGKLTDHRDFLVLNDALKWQKLQQSKAQVLNKVRSAPKILKPGSVQTPEARQGLQVNEAKSRLRKSGNVRDAAKALRAAGFV